MTSPASAPPMTGAAMVKAISWLERMRCGPRMRTPGSAISASASADARVDLLARDGVGLVGDVRRPRDGHDGQSVQVAVGLDHLLKALVAPRQPEHADAARQLEGARQSRDDVAVALSVKLYLPRLVLHELRLIAPLDLRAARSRCARRASTRPCRAGGVRRRAASRGRCRAAVCAEVFPAWKEKNVGEVCRRRCRTGRRFERSHSTPAYST